MATPKKTAQGTWRVQLDIKGFRESRTFATRREAQGWADQRAIEIRAAAAGKSGDVRTLKEALIEYAETVSPNRRGERWELLRIKAFQASPHNLPLKKPLGQVTTDDLIAWRDDRLAKVSPGTVLREIGLLQAIFQAARREWRWITHNPFEELRKPKTPAHRQRLVSGPELRAVLRALGYSKRVATVQQAAACAVLFALFTGMRAGEICALKWGDVKRDHVVLHTSKTGQGRSVPLTQGAQAVLERMRGFDGTQVFSVAPNTLDAFYRRAKARAGLSGFTFHDLRHTAATRLARKLHPMDMARMFGWRKLDMAMVYYNATASDIAKQLAL